MEYVIYNLKIAEKRSRKTFADCSINEINFDKWEHQWMFWPTVWLRMVLMMLSKWIEKYVWLKCCIYDGKTVNKTVTVPHNLHTSDLWKRWESLCWAVLLHHGNQRQATTILKLQRWVSGDFMLLSRRQRFEVVLTCTHCDGYYRTNLRCH